MTNPLLPDFRGKAVEIIRAPYRVEQHEEEQSDIKPDEINVKFTHDPWWRTRVMSIQHIRDVQEGKAFSWVWSPMKVIFDLSQVMFILAPFLAYAVDRGSHFDIYQVVALILGLQVTIPALRWILEQYHEWRFRHIPYKIISDKNR